MKRLKEEYVFLVLVCLVFMFGVYTLVKNPKKTSVAENRNLTQFSHFTIKEFLNGKFQDNFERALADQFPMSEKIRVGYGDIMVKMSNIIQFDYFCKNRYTSLPNDKDNKYRTFNCEDYIVRAPSLLGKKQFEILENNISKFSHVNSLLKSNYYIINTSSTYDFEKNEKILDFSDALKEKMSGNFEISSLKYDSFDQYKELFFKTDHHWNYKGSYRGFLDIAKMLDIDKPAKPINVINNHEYFFGTLAKAVRRYDFLEEFVMYEFSIPEHDIYINRNKQSYYNRLEDFKSHNYEYSEDILFYQFNGESKGEIIFDYHQPEKKNLLIVTDSFGHPIKELIAQYFNRTNVVDLRHYQDEMKTPFVLSEYIKENEIDEVLFIASSEFFLLEDNTTEGLEL